MAGDEAEAAGEAVPGAPTVPGYRIVALVGRGGFASVYAAEQVAVGGRVAIKVITATDADGDTLRRFERESLAMGALRGHPHIVTVLDAGRTDDGRPYLVMELVESGSLQSELVRRRRDGEGPFPLEQVLDIGVKLCSATAAAHDRGILHTDLKPGNVLLSDYGEPLLGDFGIARLLDQEASATSQAFSAGFTAPEVVQGGAPSVRSDVFSLGCTLFTILTGRSPFRREQDAGPLPALNRTVAEPVPDLRPQGVPDEVCRVLETAMAKSPSQRWSGAAQMAAALQQVQGQLGLAVTTAPMPVAPVSRRARPAAADPVSGPTVRAPAARGGGQQSPMSVAASGTTAAEGPPGVPAARRRGPGGVALVLVGVVLGVVLALTALVWWALAGEDEGSRPPPAERELVPATVEVSEGADGPGS